MTARWTAKDLFIMKRNWKKKRHSQRLRTSRPEVDTDPAITPPASSQRYERKNTMIVGRIMVIRQKSRRKTVKIDFSADLALNLTTLGVFQLITVGNLFSIFGKFRRFFFQFFCNSLFKNLYKLILMQKLSGIIAKLRKNSIF